MTIRVDALAVALAILPASLIGQSRAAAREEVIWHWFGGCATADSLALEVSLDRKPLYTSTFPICRMRRGAIRPDPEQRILRFRFVAEPHRFRAREPEAGPQPIDGNVWESSNQADALVLGISFATGDQVLLNTTHVARAKEQSQSWRVRGLVITTRPVRKP